MLRIGGGRVILGNDAESLCIVGVWRMKYEYGALVKLHSQESPMCLEKTMFQRQLFLPQILPGLGRVRTPVSAVINRLRAFQLAKQFVVS